MSSARWLAPVLLVLMVAGGLAVPRQLEAQRQCKTGCPCGNACISCSKTCRTNPGTAAKSTPTAPPKPAPAAASAPAAAALKAVATPATPGAAIWSGSQANALFFLPGCPLSKALLPMDRVTVQDSSELVAKGWKRLVAIGC